MPRPTSYEGLKVQMREALRGLAIITGDIMGDSGKAWQDHAKETAVFLRELATQLDAAANGNSEPFLVFPSPQEIVEEVYLGL